MKKQRFLLVSMLGCARAAPIWAAEAPKAEKASEAPKVQASEELRAVVRQHHDALNKQDLKALMALYADTPNVALMGTGPGEFWKGKAAIEEAYQHFFETFKAGSLKRSRSPPRLWQGSEGQAGTAVGDGAFESAPGGVAALAAGVDDAGE